ncbi:hypothetical protein PIB30_086304 [Stylosanthes scabra]|uniref:Midasin n=1 Tax=Stylosanthes scabra TaxID=79078 RepID=A0ABU6ZRW2_9FABA|nr:hypothetical protein [Stylosanthes scabra]
MDCEHEDSSDIGHGWDDGWGNTMEEHDELTMPEGSSNNGMPIEAGEIEAESSAIDGNYMEGGIGAEAQHPIDGDLGKNGSAQTERENMEGHDENSCEAAKEDEQMGKPRRSKKLGGVD